MSLYLDVRGSGEDTASGSESVEVGCEVLLLPLHPAPGAEVAQLVRGATLPSSS
jgi:hypothetical protein